MGPLAAVRSVVGFPMRLVARVLTGGLGRAPEDPERWLIVGLGNPGSRFERTRHNVGFDVLDRFAAEEGLAFGAASGGASDATAKLEKLEKLQRRSRAKLALGAVAGKRVVLVKPQTFMNLSGESVKTLMRHYRVSNDRLLVVYDDLDTPVARLKLKGKGGHGGHNGVRNIIDECPGCSDKTFPRLKIGVGRPTSGAPVYDHVLTRFDERDRAVLEGKTFPDACDVIRAVLTSGLDRAMTAANDASGGGGGGGGGGKGHRGKGQKETAPSTRGKKPADPARPTRDDDAVVATLVRDAVARIVASGAPVTLAHGRAAANEPPP